MNTALSVIYIIGFFVALIYSWRELDPIGMARDEMNSDFWAGADLIMGTLVVVITAVLWPGVLVFVGGAWLIGTLIGKAVR